MIKLQFNVLVPFFATFIIVAVAELGDKTQLLSIGFAARHKPKIVIAALSISTSLLMLIAVTAGKLFTKIIPASLIQLMAGILFIVFGGWMFFSDDDDGEKDSVRRNRLSPFWTVFSSFFLAELGDKTQLATAALALKYSDIFSVWLGATLGMVSVNLIGIVIGNRLQAFLSPQLTKKIAAAVFLLFGLIALLSYFI